MASGSNHTTGSTRGAELCGGAQEEAVRESPFEETQCMAEEIASPSAKRRRLNEDDAVGANSNDAVTDDDIQPDNRQAAESEEPPGLPELADEQELCSICLD